MDIIVEFRSIQGEQPTQSPTPGMTISSPRKPGIFYRSMVDCHHGKVFEFSKSICWASLLMLRGVRWLPLVQRNALKSCARSGWAVLPDLFWSVCLFVCLSVCLSVSLSVCLSDCPPCLPARMLACVLDCYKLRCSAQSSPVALICDHIWSALFKK